MIKRISTLFAGFALLGAMTASASVSTIDPQIKLNLGQNDALYQLGAFDSEGDTLGVLGVADGVNETNLLKIMTKPTAFDPSTYWCVTVTQENKGQDPIYDFINKGAQCFLDASNDLFLGLGATPTTSTKIRLGGEIGGWAYSAAFQQGIADDPQPLCSHISHDSVVYIVKNNFGQLVLQRQLATDPVPGSAIYVKLQKINGFQLTADQINNKLGLLSGSAIGKVKLTFVPDKNNTSIKNPFSDTAFSAVDADLTGFVNIKNGEKYLYVDTAYTNANGAKFLAFNYADNLADIDGISGNAKFEFTYFPTNDSLVIQVRQAIYTPGPDGFYSAGSQTQADQLNHYIGALNTGDNSTVQYANGGSQGNFITVQDLVKDDQIRIVTVRDEKESDINLGYKSCAVSSDWTSLADSVYTIQNAKGQYLAVPISNCLSGTVQHGGLSDAATVYAQWMNVEAASQNVNHMPAYQWVILKNKTNPYFAGTSSVTAFNREYPAIRASVQLHKDTVNNIVTATILHPYFMTEAGQFADEHAIAEGAEDGLTFNGVPAINDAKIGYKKLTDEEIKYTTAIYSLNYFNPYVKNMYVAKTGSNLTATGDSTAFVAIKAVNGALADQAYGFGTDMWTSALKSRISTLAVLVRNPYYMTLSGGLNVGVADDEATRGDEVVASAKVDAVPFFFKENNFYNNKNYYSLVVAVPQRELNRAFGAYFPKCLKVGVADQTLNAMLQLQCGCESRTSSFAIDVTDLALYRHFNNKNLGEVEGRDSLKFYENVRHEYLMDENNVNLQNKNWEATNNHTIDYLGIWTKDKASLSGKALGLQLDTVWVNRGLGNIKPQYIISVAHNDVAAVDTIPCTEATPHHDINGNLTDAMHCAHAIPGHAGFEYGKYLISFADSDAVVPYTDVEGGYYRLAFKKAIHIADTLIFLEDADAALAPATLSPSALIAKYTKAGYKGNGSVCPLTGDNHKNYTWAFRYTNPGMGANATEEGSANSFLIESSNFDGQSIAPENAGWVKMQNGCLTITKEPSLFNNAKTGADGALIFNVEKLGADNMVTDAATVTASDFSVIAGEGQVTINGAAGKKVVVSNILGQTVANTVLTSDNATIAAPAGVVVVAVEGEAAVKAIVK